MSKLFNYLKPAVSEASKINGKKEDVKKETGNGNSQKVNDNAGSNGQGNGKNK